MIYVSPHTCYHHDDGGSAGEAVSKGHTVMSCTLAHYLCTFCLLLCDIVGSDNDEKDVENDNVCLLLMMMTMTTKMIIMFMMLMIMK
jgi:hypothetical protein